MAASVLWFTGLSGAGKSTIADGLKARLASEGLTVEVLDGDAVRESRNRQLGFNKADVKQNNRLIVERCRCDRDAYDVIIVSIISPYADVREYARETLTPGFFEIFVKADLDTVMARDVKGLYARAKAGELTNLIGYSDGAGYELPKEPDLALDTVHQEVEESIEALYRLVRRTHSERSIETEAAPTP